jgi:hypothetical protein
MTDVTRDYTPHRARRTCELGHDWPVIAERRTGICPICDQPAKPKETPKEEKPNLLGCIALVLAAVGICGVLFGTSVVLQMAAFVFALVFVIVFMLLCFFTFSRGPARYQKHMQRLRAAAERHQLIYAEEMSDQLLERLQELPYLHPPEGTIRSSGHEVLQGNVAGQEVIIAEVIHEVPNSTDTYMRVAVWFDAAQAMPDFTLWPKGIEDRLLRLFRPFIRLVKHDLDIDGSAAKRKFSQLYWIEAADQSEVGVLFTPELLQFFEKHPGWTIQCACGHWLFSYDEPKTLWQTCNSPVKLTAKELDELISRPREIIGLFGESRARIPAEHDA